MLELQNRVQSAEYMLRTQFANMVGDLVLAELAAPYITGIDQEAPHEPIDDFALWAITGNNDEDEDIAPTLWHAEYDYSIPEAKTWHCICLDTMFGIGLSFHGHLAAFAAGGVTEEGSLRIEQLQGATDNLKDPIAARGRRGGFYWTDTLVGAWMHIGRRLGLETVELLPGEKNSWLRPNEPERNTRIIRKYTTTAYRCGFDRGEPGEIWVRDL
jgi:hypothetical protein